jgi:hypothetical protein
MTPDEWAKDQLKPLSMFELAKWWADGIKVAGAGNGAGLVAAGAALTPFHDHHAALILVKIAGGVFFIGVLGFALALLNLYKAMHAQDEVSQATLHKNAEAISANSKLSGTSMVLANKCAGVSIAAFFVGLIIGLAAFLAF